MMVDGWTDGPQRDPAKHPDGLRAVRLGRGLDIYTTGY